MKKILILSAISVIIISLAVIIISLAVIINQNDLLGGRRPIASSQWENTGSVVHYIQGNVGIGTTTPDEIFQVVNGSSTTTIAVGSVNSGAKPGKACLWNGSEFTVTSFSSGSTTPSYATSTTCQ